MIGYTFPATNGVITNSRSGTTSTLTINGTTAGPYLGTVQDGSGKIALVFAGTGAEPFSGTNNYSGGTTVNSGTVIVPKLGTLGTGNITVNAGLIVQQTPSSTIFNLLRSGYAGGNWNGTGINSSLAAADTTHLTAVGMLVPNGSVSFRGQTLNLGDVGIQYTYYGDANLDGKVDGSDYSLIDTGYLSNGSLTGWQNGDFNYDGSIDGSDYTLIDNAYNRQGAALSTSVEIAGPTAEVAGVSRAAVPEPAMLGLASLAAMALVGRRRR